MIWSANAAEGFLMERFYVPPDALHEDHAWITGDELKHLSVVLRLRAGDPVEVFDGRGRGFSGRLAEVGKTHAVVVREAPITEARDSALRIGLAQGIPKGDRMEWITQKATELGVDSLLPLELDRCVVHLGGETKRQDRQARWQKTALEAAKQCGRLTVPTVLPPVALDPFLRRIQPSDLLLIPWEQGGQPLRDFFAEEERGKMIRSPGEGQIWIMIGPEGGMTEAEVETGRRIGGRVLTLGPRILRTDTAGLMLLSVLQHRWGDMG